MQISNIILSEIKTKSKINTNRRYFSHLDWTLQQCFGGLLKSSECSCKNTDMPGLKNHITYRMILIVFMVLLHTCVTRWLNILLIDHSGRPEPELGESGFSHYGSNLRTSWSRTRASLQQHCNVSQSALVHSDRDSRHFTYKLHFTSSFYFYFISYYWFYLYVCIMYPSCTCTSFVALQQLMDKMDNNRW